MKLGARYRELIDPQTALRRLLADTPPGRLEPERIAVEDAAGRCCAEAVHAAISAPPYHAAAMDGIAVRSAATAGASPTRPLELSSPAEAIPIDTGDPLPAGYDAVVPVEQINPTAGGGYEIQAAVAARQHVRLTGEDMVAGEMILPAGRLIQPAHVGAMLGAGVVEIAVRRRPRVAILPTGDELCEPGQDPSGGGVIESNSRMLSASVRIWGGRPQRRAPVADDPQRLAAAIEAALAEADVLLVLAGSSAGRDDYTPHLIAEQGELLFHGLRVMPGKPTAGGRIDGKPVLGIPGFPVSAAVAADLLLRPLLAHLLGTAAAEPERLSARLARAVTSRPGLEERLRVVVGRFATGHVAAPLGRGAGAITTLSRAHGLIAVPPASEGLAAGSPVEVALLQPRAVIDAGLLLAGSNDLALSLLDDLLGQHRPGASLSVSPLGSLAGLAALARGEAHLAGAHLLDPVSGTYNLVDVARMLPGRRLALVTLGHRQQGLCLRADDERRPTDLAAVIEQGLRWVNRQPGSGTRVLTEHLLARDGLQAEQLAGWSHEEFTHVAVAEAVRSGVADCGMLILAAARALGLRFIPLVEERFDLVLPAESLQDERIADLLQVLGSDAFRQRMEALGGYDGRETGRVREVGGDENK